MSEENTEIKEYDAFISYSREDKEFAIKLYQELENYNPPEIDDKKLHKIKVFLDTEDLTAGGDYYDRIDKSLLTTRKLIIICSPSARKSQYVNDEIRRFAVNNDPHNIIPIIVDGIPNNEAKKPADEAKKAFPEELVKALAMPLAIS